MLSVKITFVHFLVVQILLYKLSYTFFSIWLYSRMLSLSNRMLIINLRPVRYNRVRNGYFSDNAKILFKQYIQNSNKKKLYYNYVQFITQIQI